MQFPCIQCNRSLPEHLYCAHTHNDYVVYYRWYGETYHTDVFIIPLGADEKILDIDKWIDLAGIEKLLLLR